ncbi:hypothetical protein [Parapedobacter sp. 10938]|uniref:hypothetical protein n=1 Tax=Parapedobacter flavus TaxID=3110225 RepID=UPI002DBBC3E4|nr:hypothetical protein [Parapedobacter sp. 10938]MEC3880804.1 hypothetical protein [Parapedobacter sp. 10938]
MKSLVLSAMICAAAVGTSVARTNVNMNLPSEKIKKEHTVDQKSVAAFKQVIAFHQRNVDVLFNQFEIAKEHVRESRGSHADLDRDEAFFIQVYQADIDKGLRVEASKKAIAEIEAMYTKKHEARDAHEAERLAKLRSQLQTELEKERKQFKKAKRKFAGFVNEETLPLLKKAEQYFARAIDRAENADVDHMTVAVR